MSSTDEKEILKILESNAKFIENQARLLRSYYFHKRNKWLFYIPFYQMAYLWKTTIYGLKNNELIMDTVKFNLALEKHYKIKNNINKIK